MTSMMMTTSISMPLQACHSGTTSSAELLRALESVATTRVLDRVRTPLPCGQAAYESLLSRQLERAGTKGAVEALSELQDPLVVQLARFEYRLVFGAIVAKIDILGRREFSRDWLLRLWPPMRHEDTERVVALVEDIHAYLDQLPRDALQHLRPSIATRPGRGVFRREYRLGVVLAAEHMRWYHPQVDTQALARDAWRALPRQRVAQSQSVEAFEAVIRRTFSRKGLGVVRPSRRRLAQGLSADRWVSSAVGRWFAPFRPLSLGDSGGHLAAVKAELDAAHQSRTRGTPVPSNYESAMTHYLPEEVWRRVAPILASVPTRAARRSDARSATLGIAVYLAADVGWGNLPNWLTVSASTVRRLVERLRKAGRWPDVRQRLLAGPHGGELDAEKLP